MTDLGEVFGFCRSWGKVPEWVVGGEGIEGSDGFVSCRVDTSNEFCWSFSFVFSALISADFGSGLRLVTARFM